MSKDYWVIHRASLSNEDPFFKLDIEAYIVCRYALIDSEGHLPYIRNRFQILLLSVMMAIGQKTKESNELGC